MCKIANYPKKISDGWLFVVRTVKVRYFFIFRAYVETYVKHDYTNVKNIYIICGKTDMRKGIDGLATLIQDTFKLDPYGDSIFLFSGWSKDRYKCLYFDGDGFAMLYKRLDNGKLQQYQG
ncbi:IS66 family insertion sequence element accessory protein TnpB [Heyndrickxia vini]|uniref:IS66 family insertion sequence element accessory protein TnpB n=1 Tax=Heyndrickxia vini TaxID=1476025 RepID=A0ABX7DZZ3_9BACI|nr:IS66 family insertion sequence element accessory protein TnpB [Heyndrickxia vini]QQZ08837.1 IS66 family insertion sequence element accessory protein TnpB [Heyndrickxia vini]